MYPRGSGSLYVRRPAGLFTSSSWTTSHKPFFARLLSSTPSVKTTTDVKRKVKETTGIAGLDVVPNAREVLIGLYNKYLVALEGVEPTSPFRKLAENMTKERLRIVEENEDIEKIEQLIDYGQVEELIQDAMDDIAEVPWWIEHKPWEDSPHKRVPVFEREF
jgi:hypothetical protein